MPLRGIEREHDDIINDFRVEKNAEVHKLSEVPEHVPTLDDYTRALEIIDAIAKNPEQAENFPDYQDNRLSNEAAQEEANMIRVETGQDPKTGTIGTENLWYRRKPIKDDYEQALVVIEEIKHLAKNESTGRKVLFKLAKPINTVLEQIGFWTGVMLSGFGGDLPSEGAHQEILHRFDDAETKLKQLIKKSDKFGQAQSKDESIKNK